jgi:hypothetical protein
MNGVADQYPADADPDPLIHCDADLDQDLCPTLVLHKLENLEKKFNFYSQQGKVTFCFIFLISLTP